MRGGASGCGPYPWSSSRKVGAYVYGSYYRALQVTCLRLGAKLSYFGGYHHGNAFQNLVTTAPNLIRTLHNLFRRLQLQTKSFLSPISIDK